MIDRAPDAPPKIVWQPIPGSQALALDSRANHTLYTGARGPGKTDTQLMRFRKYVGRGYGEFWRGIIFDREYKNLDDLIAKSKRWFYAFEDGAKFKESTKDLKWVWPTGEELLFRAVTHRDDYWNYHGQEYPFIGWNELTKFPTGELYESMKSINRSSYTPQKDGWVGGILNKGADVPVGPDGELPEPIPLQMFSTANPWGAGHAWVKRQFIDPAEYGEIVTEETKVFNPATQKDEVAKVTQVAIFGTYRENIYLDKGYIAGLNKIKDKNKRLAWLAGSWDIVAGGAIDDVWDTQVHILPRFEIPEGWRINRSFDWGSTQPFATTWFAEANGEDIRLPDGTTKSMPKGTIILIDEYYGTDRIGTNEGWRMSAKDIALNIKKKEAKLMGGDGQRRWIKSRVAAGPADNQIGNVVDSGEETIKTRMAREGVHWLPSDKSKGSRIIGLQLLRDRLEASMRNEGMGFYIMEHCKFTKNILPTLPRDEDNPDDIDTEAEDHLWDAIRYRLLQGYRAQTADVKVGLPT